MARIRIRNYVVTSDANNWTVVEVRVVKDPASRNHGQEYEYALGYYPKLSAALEGLLEFVARSSEADSLAALLVEVRAFREEIQRALDEPPQRTR
jgi:hypothetical protein